MAAQNSCCRYFMSNPEFPMYFFQVLFLGLLSSAYDFSRVRHVKNVFQNALIQQNTSGWWYLSSYELVLEVLWAYTVNYLTGVCVSAVENRILCAAATVLRRCLT